MRKLYRTLKSSVLVLALVICVYAAKDYFKEDTKQQSTQTSAIQTTQALKTKDDVLPTVDVNLYSDGGSYKTNDDVKADYHPMQGSGKLVADSAAETATGSTAKTYQDFPEQMYPYRAMLSESQQAVYDQIYESVGELEKEVTLCRQLEQSSIKNVMNAVFNDHPEFFWLDTDYSYGYTSKGTVVSVTLQYNSTADSMQSSRTAFLEAASKIINTASTYAADEEKEKYVYKSLQNICEYDEDSEMNQSAYSALVLGSSVCAGYSRAFQYIMQQLNIPCYFCTGYANGGNHAWNIVYIDGKYVNVDLSWDDSLGEISNTISYAYYNLSDKAFSVDHTRRELSLNLPKCD
jgi:transglutaminase/protease-like cytokinesis protein 3